MNNLTISNIDDDMKYRMQKRAEQNGRSIEEEAREILRLALTDNQEHPLNIVDRIELRFADLGDFELSEIPR